MTKSEAGRLGAEKSRIAGVTRKAERVQTYKAAPSTCLRCLVPLPYDRRRNKFCSHTCAAIHTHTGLKCPNRKNARHTTCGCGNGVASGRTWCATCISAGKHLHRKMLDEMTHDKGRRTHLLRTRPHRCEYPGCGIETWLGQPVPLEMDHVDGDSDNNTEENLRLLCPNCHALTPSHKGRNRGKGRTRQRTKNERYAAGLTY